MSAAEYDDLPLIMLRRKRKSLRDRIDARHDRISDLTADIRRFRIELNVVIGEIDRLSAMTKRAKRAARRAAQAAEDQQP